MSSNHQGTATSGTNQEGSPRRSRRHEELSELLPDTLDRTLGLEGVRRRSKGGEPAPSSSQNR